MTSINTQIKRLRWVFEERPEGGTGRERQAWRNGFREAIETLLELETGQEPEFVAEWVRRMFPDPAVQR